MACVVCIPECVCHCVCVCVCVCVYLLPWCVCVCECVCVYVCDCVCVHFQTQKQNRWANIATQDLSAINLTLLNNNNRHEQKLKLTLHALRHAMQTNRPTTSHCFTPGAIARYFTNKLHTARSRHRPWSVLFLNLDLPREELPTVGLPKAAKKREKKKKEKSTSTSEPHSDLYVALSSSVILPEALLTQYVVVNNRFPFRLPSRLSVKLPHSQV